MTRKLNCKRVPELSLRLESRQQQKRFESSLKLWLYTRVDNVVLGGLKTRTHIQPETDMLGVFMYVNHVGNAASTRFDFCCLPLRLNDLQVEYLFLRGVVLRRLKTRPLCAVHLVWPCKLTSSPMPCEYARVQQIRGFTHGTVHLTKVKHLFNRPWGEPMQA